MAQHVASVLLVFLCLGVSLGHELPASTTTTCAMPTETGVGYTANDNFYKLLKNVLKADDCCSACAADSPKCYAWTWHSKSLECSLAEAISRTISADAVSGHRAGPAPPPTPTCPSPPPAPKPPRGEKPNIILFLTDGRRRRVEGGRNGAIEEREGEEEGRRERTVCFFSFLLPLCTQ